MHRRLLLLANRADPSSKLGTTASLLDDELGQGLWHLTSQGHPSHGFGKESCEGSL